MSNPTHELAQKVCHRYGWSADFFRNEDGYWSVKMTLGVGHSQTFVSEDSSPDTASERKQGIRAASQVALEGLEEEIRKQESKPRKSLRDVFSTDIDIYQSNKENWEYFWKHKPTMVGIDVEGNQKSPPVLVQIATDSYTILETPRTRISSDLQRLLQDESIVKVFCDNYSQHDKKSLGILDDLQPVDFMTGHIVDVEVIGNTLLGPVKVARGIGRLVTLTMPEIQVLIEKPKRTTFGQKGRMAQIGRFAMIEQNKAPPLKSIEDLSHEEQQYAALDAWCTLQVYQRLMEASATLKG